MQFTKKNLKKNVASHTLKIAWVPPLVIPNHNSNHLPGSSGKNFEFESSQLNLQGIPYLCSCFLISPLRLNRVQIIHFPYINNEP